MQKAAIVRPHVTPAGDLTECAREYFDYLAAHTSGGFCVDECTLCGTLLQAREALLAVYAATELERKPTGWRGVLS